ncbi:lachesin isoform X1 [Wyeomyia smithii]|uniref:lachesin isoform X1 n=1 Tax=Wyeomyia smithii TaxID=174621 RepID=UPI0024682008|nr:lachesin isoform X1 [Wyeomyia smithii]XP_055533092.1 lachesin isoform X1 [Wyeomyia smithii]
MNPSLKISLSSAGLLFVTCWLSLVKDVCTFQPDFAEPIINISVAIGRDATFTCHVRHLGGYRVGWVKADTKAIQAIHENVITHNPRVSVSHADQNTWNLHIKSVTEDDRGGYMCQLNTDPMKSQLGYLDVVIPPDFIAEDTSSDVIVPEGSSVKLTCRAKGYPEPVVTWRREDSAEIILKDAAGTKQGVNSYRGEVLKLTKISRSEMGSYLCIASNGVPPSVSKRISLSIHFHPVIQVPNQLVGAPLGTDVSIECQVEASPKSINYWVKDTGEMIVSSPKYHVQDTPKSLYETKMTMTVRSFQKEDVGSYRCIAKNSLGEVDSSIRLYEIPGPNRKVYSPKYGTDQNDIVKPGQTGAGSKSKLSYPPDDEEQQYGGGSAEDFDEVIDTIQHQHHHHHQLQQQHHGGGRPTARSPFGSLDHPNSINGVVIGSRGSNGGSSGASGGNNGNNKNLIALMNDIGTRKPFVIPPGRGVDGSLEGNNGVRGRLIGTADSEAVFRLLLVLLGSGWFAIYCRRHLG